MSFLGVPSVLLRLQEKDKTFKAPLHTLGIERPHISE